MKDIGLHAEKHSKDIVMHCRSTQRSVYVNCDYFFFSGELSYSRADLK